MAQLQHWIVNCTTCDSPAEYHCNTCGDILCPRCREIHQSSRGTGYHSIVPYTERVEPGKLAGQCDAHPGNQCMLWCQTCDKAAYILCVTSVDHKGHVFVQFASKVDEQKKVIREDFQNLTELLKTWKDSLRQIEGSLSTYQNDIDELGKEITRSADRVCDQVRAIEAALQKQLLQMKTSLLSILHDQETVVQNGIEDIKQQIKTTEDKLRSGDVGDLVHYKTQEAKTKGKDVPDRILPPPPTFTLGKLDIPVLEAMLGELSMTTEKYREKSTGESKLLNVFTKSNEMGNIACQKELSQTSSSVSTVISSEMALLPEGTVISTIQTDLFERPYLACSGSGQVWIRTGKNKLRLMDRRGIVQNTIKTNLHKIAGMAISQQGDILFSGDKVIMSVSDKGSTRYLFRTEWEPYGICVLQNDDVLVAFCKDGRVVRYSSDGQVIKELDKSLFKHPRNVAQNRINNHLYVCDKLGTNFFTPGKLLAVDEVNGKVLYEYTGPDDTTFTPMDVCTDQAGHAIITDYGNDRIHILDQDGRFLQYMLTQDQGLYKPFSIDVDTYGYASVAEYKLRGISHVKILKYLK